MKNFCHHVWRHANMILFHVSCCFHGKKTKPKQIPANLWVMNAQGIPSNTETSFTDEKKNNTVMEKLKVNGSIWFKISSICDSLVCYWTPEKSQKKVSLETVKKYSLIWNLFKSISAPYSRDTLIKNDVLQFPAWGSSWDKPVFKSIPSMCTMRLF